MKDFMKIDYIMFINYVKFISINSLEWLLKITYSLYETINLNYFNEYSFNKSLIKLFIQMDHNYI